jgi:hypothetical protein
VTSEDGRVPKRASCGWAERPGILPKCARCQRAHSLLLSFDPCGTSRTSNGRAPQLRDVAYQLFRDTASVIHDALTPILNRVKLWLSPLPLPRALG